MLIAHASDLHIRWSPGGGPSLRDVLSKRLLGRLNLAVGRRHPSVIVDALFADLAVEPPDHLILTGDFTNLALQSEFERAKAYLDRLELPPERVSLIPGNHDTYTRRSHTARLLETTFADYLDGPETVWPRLQERDQVAIVSATSCVPTPWFRAWGLLGEAQLERIGELLRASSAPLKLVLAHHPPLLWNGKPDSESHGNRDGEALLRVCQDAGADLLLCGHVHKNYAYHLPTPRPLWLLVAGSATQMPNEFGRAATYNRYRIEDGRLRDVEVRAFDVELGRFRTARTWIPEDERTAISPS